jgi:hypothetical protein
MATFTKLKSGSWRAQVRRKGKYVNESFLRRRDAEEWALDIERRIDRGESPTKRARRDAKTFGDLVRLHRDDLRDVGRQIGRSKSASLIFPERRLGTCKLGELDRERLIQFGRDRAKEGAGPVTLGIGLWLHQNDIGACGRGAWRSGIHGTNRSCAHCAGSTWIGGEGDQATHFEGPARPAGHEESLEKRPSRFPTRGHSDGENVF